MIELLAMAHAAVHFLALLVVASLAVVGAAALAIVINLSGDFLLRVVKTWRS